MTAGPAPGRAADPARTVFFGSGAFAVPVLDVVQAHPRLRLVAVVTGPDRPAGRSKAMSPTPVAVRAREIGVPVLQPTRVRNSEAVAEIAALQPDLGVLADYGQIIPRALLELPAHGILNVHPSLLPRHRGATPIPATIAAGDPEGGVSIIRMDDGIDTGPVVAARRWPLEGRERASAFEALAGIEGAALLRDTIAAWLDGTAVASPQRAEAASVTSPFRREDGRLDPSRPARELERQVRANEPWPGTFVDTGLGRVAVLAAGLSETQDGDTPGLLVEEDGRLALATSEGRLVIEEAKREGRRPTGGREFLRGQGRLVGTHIAEPAAPLDIPARIEAPSR
ncbi:MAG TPA: methionyl-tRNA formyltransferase [Candidatus Limnocylindria bacterium]|nr:methionyl-tRNA formyltransferase [Candidatus Limnocylindria bacterium]